MSKEDYLPAIRSRMPLLMGLLFSSLLFYIVLLVSVSERRADFSAAGQVAMTDLREQLGDGERLIDGVALLFSASGHVTETEFEAFVRPQLARNSQAQLLAFMPAGREGNLYWRDDEAPLLQLEDRGLAFQPLYLSSGYDRELLAWIGQRVFREEHSINAIKDTLEKGSAGIGGFVRLENGEGVYPVFKAVYQERPERQLLGVLVALIKPAVIVEHIAEVHKLNTSIQIGGQAAGAWRCCRVEPHFLLPGFMYTDEFEYKGNVFGVEFSRALGWEDVHLKVAVVAFIIGVLLSVMMMRLRNANTAKTRLLLERNQIIHRQVAEQTRELRAINAELEQQKYALDQHSIVSISDVAGNITYVNEKFCEISGYSKEELLGRNHRIVKSSYHPDSFYREMWNSISRGKAWHGVICNRAKNGSEYWVNSSIVPFLDVHGLPYQYVSIRTDVTPLKAAERAIAAQRYELNTILDNVPAMIWYKDREGRVLRANRAAAALTEEASERIGGIQANEFCLPEAVMLCREREQRVIRSGEPDLGFLQPYDAGDAGEAWAKVDRVPYRDAEGNILGVIVMAVDVSKTIAFERQLSISEDRLKRSQSFANIGTWDWNIRSGDLYWSERIAPLFGYEPGEVETTYENFVAALHPDDRQHVLDAVDACVSRGVDYNIEHRVVWQDGSVRWLLERGDVVRDDNNEPLHMLGVVQDITDRKLAEEALRSSEAAFRESEEKFRGLYELAPVGIALNEMDGTFVEANQSFLDIVGYTADECRNLTYWELTPEEYAPQEGVQLESLNTLGRYGPYEKEYIHKEGHRVAVLLNGTIVHDREGNRRIWSIVQDVTELKQAEKQLNQFKTSLDLTEDCVFMFAPDDLCFFYVNHGAMEQVGYRYDELLQMTPVDLKPDYDEAAFRALLQPLREGKQDSLTFETVHRHKNGSLIPVEIMLQYIAPSGEPPRFVAIVRNIAERKLLERNLIDAKEEAEKADRAKSEFLSSMSHELRTPLNAVIGFAQLLQSESNLNAQQQENVRDILKAGHLLLTLINEVLDLSRIEAGKLELSIDRVSLHDLLGSSIAMIQPQAAKRSVVIEYDETSTQGVWLHADYTRTKQVLLNLLSNAVKYNRDGGQVTVSCRTGDEGMVRIGVKDSGMGIAQEKLPKLFEPFNRLGAESTGIEGTGIGLVITLQLVEMMGGRIGVESVEGEGSCFWFELPRMVGEQEAAGPDNVKASKDRLQIAAHGRVLYIEDNPVNIKLVSQLISRKTRLQLISTADPQHGLALAKEKAPDLILLDINLPGMDGYEVLRRLRSEQVTRDIPVVALSANAMDSDLRRGEEAGFNGYLTKPIDIKDFFRVLAEQLPDT